MATIGKEKALDVVRQMVADGQVSQEVAEKYFPELAESEDERIRKELIDYFSASHTTDTFRGISWDKVVVWLEKQGDEKEYTFKAIPRLLEMVETTERAKAYCQKLIDTLTKEGYVTDAKIVGECLKKMNGEQVALATMDDQKINKSEDERIRQKFIKLVKMSNEVGGFALHKWEADEMLAWLEKQKEYESTDFEYVWDRTDCGDLTSALDKYSKEAIINMCHAWYDKGIELERKSWLEKQGYNKKDVDDAYLKGICDAKHELEKQGGQKPADKVEPKFQNGQWIVWQNKCYKVNDNGCGYELVDQNGLSTSLEYGTVDKSAHLWAIQDAKDGDVLVFKNNIGGIIICKSPSDYDTRSYCRLIRDNLINKEESGWDSTLLVPATKEQCELLFQKMKKAGYTFDFEKKELKKIDNEEVNGEDYGIDGLWHAQRILEKTLGKVEGYQTDDGILSHKCAITAVKKLYGQKPAKWSLEDERVIAIINNALTESNTPPDDYDKVYDWLESIKQRIGWKPSNEQIDTLEHFVRSIGESGYASPYDNNTKLLYSLLEQLKKLTE